MDQFTRPIPAQRPDRRVFGITLMLGAAFVMSATDAAGKWVVAGYPVAELNFVRSLFSVGLLIPVLWRSEGAAGWRTQRPMAHAGRALLAVTLTAVWFFSLRAMPLADAATLAMCAPFFMTALSVWLLGEHVGWKRWAAIAIGFGGVLLIVRPGTSVFQPISLLVVAAAFGYALYMVTNRVLTATESVTALTLFPQLAVLIGSAAMAPFVWVPPTLGGVAAMAFTGVCAGVGHLLLTIAFRYAPASVLAPLDYTALIWAVIFGFVLFGTLPDRWVVGGMALIVGAGLVIVWREAVAKRRLGAA